MGNSICIHTVCCSWFCITQLSQNGSVDPLKNISIFFNVFLGVLSGHEQAGYIFNEGQVDVIMYLTYLLINHIKVLAATLTKPKKTSDIETVSIKKWCNGLQNCFYDVPMECHCFSTEVHYGKLYIIVDLKA